jgi:hypothetical protein
MAVAARTRVFTRCVIIFLPKSQVRSPPTQLDVKPITDVVGETTGLATGRTRPQIVGVCGTRDKKPAADDP